jgi:hypothetical protein
MLLKSAARQIEGADMTELEKNYGVPAELKQFVDDGFLTVAIEKPEEKTVTFAIPKLAYRDENDNEMYFTLDWIHPDFNADFCHYYHENPGDLPNFYLRKECRSHGDEDIDLESLADLIAWLEERRVRA